ncbi:hypothetical protein [Kitasatospora sp. NPDC097643]|uniref:hypothetical protein n=1 Tax=Kitasatospora sp. NPDC097643 TaxID=3157230 RepID=UPI00332633D0
MSLRRLATALLAPLAVIVAIVLPATPANAYIQGSVINTGNWTGVYIWPNPNGGKNPAAQDLPPGTQVSLECTVTGADFGGGSAPWYLVSGEWPGGAPHSWAGWLYAPFVDGSRLANSGSLPKCDPYGGVIIGVNNGHNIGQYSCPAVDNCHGYKNAPDVPMGGGNYVKAVCWTRGQNYLGYGDIWYEVEQAAGDPHYDSAAWVFAPYVDNGSAAYNNFIQECRNPHYSY